YWLSKKSGKLAWIEPLVDRQNQTYRFVVRTGLPTDEQKSKIEAGTKLGRGCKFRCVLSDEPIPEGHIKAEGPAGRLGLTLLAAVADGPRGRIWLSQCDIPRVDVDPPGDMHFIDAPLANDPRNLWCLGYGLDTFDKLFTARQLRALTTVSDLVEVARQKVLLDAEAVCASEDDRRLRDGGDGPVAYADGVATYLAIALSRSTNTHCTLAIWSTSRDQSINAFGRQAIPMAWDFPEVNPFAGAAGDLEQSISSMTNVMLRLPAAGESCVEQLDAVYNNPKIETPLISTDPPYYDNIGYSDLSDFFYVWLRRSLSTVYTSLFSTLVTPKKTELIVNPYRHDGNAGAAQQFFEKGLGTAFKRIREDANQQFPLTVFYAFKQSETEDDDGSETGIANSTASTGWETMLEGLVSSGLSIHGTWPLRTERDQGLKTGTNVLASSIVLVCRPRRENASLATRKEFIVTLRRELPDALRNLQRGNIAPVDLAQAAIGPGMAVYTRYAKVLESDGSPMTVRTALGLINQSLDEVLAEQEGEFDGDTRWALAWFEQFGMEDGAFGDAETLSKAKNTAINGLVEAGIVTARAGKVRLVKRDELPLDWNPATDKRLTVWEITQHLIHRLDQQGEMGASKLVTQLGGIAEISRDLAYRLYSTCERKKWAQEALAYNSLVVAWPELTKLAMSERTGQQESQKEQKEMF
ncbi:MAG: hypothetical protein WCH39_25710, partial [Schlesneria sp.]